MPFILDGKKARAARAEGLQARIAALQIKPTLAIVQVGAREESTAYIERKKRFGASLGVSVRHVCLAESMAEAELLSRIGELNADADVSGVIVQLPLPERFDRTKIQNAVALAKDVDGLAEGSGYVPATARGILELLEFYAIPLVGKKVAMLGRSELVGAPTARLLEKAGAVVTVCHSKTPNTKEITRASDIVIAAIGKPRFVGQDFFRENRTQVVIDAGITAVTNGETKRLEEEVSVQRDARKKKLVGDVDFEQVKKRVYAISPVPGGVGPMTVLALFENLADGAILHR